MAVYIRILSHKTLGVLQIDVYVWMYCGTVLYILILPFLTFGVFQIYVYTLILPMEIHVYTLVLPLKTGGSRQTYMFFMKPLKIRNLMYFKYMGIFS